MSDHADSLSNLATKWIFKEREKGIPNQELYQVLEFAVWAEQQQKQFYCEENEGDGYF